MLHLKKQVEAVFGQSIASWPHNRAGLTINNLSLAAELAGA